MPNKKKNLSESETFLIAEFRPLNSRGKYSIGITSGVSEEGFNLESQLSTDFKKGEILEVQFKHPGSGEEISSQGKLIETRASWYKFILVMQFHKTDQDRKKRVLELAFTKRDNAEPLPEKSSGHGKGLKLKGADTDKENTDSEKPPARKLSAHSTASHESIDASTKSIHGTDTSGIQENSQGAHRYQEQFNVTPQINSNPAKKTRVSVILMTVFVILILVALPTLYNNIEQISGSAVLQLATTHVRESPADTREANPGSFTDGDIVTDRTGESSLIVKHIMDNIVLPEAQETAFHEGTANKDPDSALFMDTPLEEALPSDPMATSSNDKSIQPPLQETVKSTPLQTITETQNEFIADGKETKYVVYASILNIRSAPSVTSPVVGKLHRGKIFTSGESEKNDEGQWLKIDNGYVFGAYTVALHYDEQ